MNKSGLLVSSILQADDDKYLIGREYVQFSQDDIEHLKKDFDKINKQSRLINNSFDDYLWILQQKNEGNIFRRNIDFADIKNKDLIDVVKGFTINELINSISINSIAQYVAYIEDVMIRCNYFNTEKMDDLEEYLYNKNAVIRVQIKEVMFKFMNYMNEFFNIDEDYYELFQNISYKGVKKSRKLPDFKSVLYFEYFLNQFLKNNIKNKYLLNYYLPIILWWKITSVIPMRVSEFLCLKKSYLKKEKNKYYLTVKRQKPHSFLERSTGKRKIQTFRITKEVYQLLVLYISNDSSDSSYIFSVNVFDKCTNHNLYSVHGQPILIYQFNMLLEEIYNEFSKYIEIFGYKINDGNNKDATKIITKIKPGDTRHFAIMNLVLQGADPYIVKEMAGHRDINSHMNYIDHAEEYISSKTMVLTDLYKFQLKDEKLNINVRNRRYEKAMLVNKDSYIKVGAYYCKRYVNNRKEFPYLCMGECRECTDGILDIYNCHKEEIDKEINCINNSIKENLEIIKSYMKITDKKSFIDYKTGNVSNSTKKILKSCGTEMNNLICRAAKLKVLVEKKGTIENE